MTCLVIGLAVAVCLLIGTNITTAGFLFLAFLELIRREPAPQLEDHR